MRNRGIVYHKMMASFVAVLAIPLCMVVAFYFFSYTVTEKQAELSNDNFVRTIQSACDQEIQYYQNVLVQISLNQVVSENVEEIDFWNLKNQIEIMGITTMLQESRSSLSLKDDVCYDLFVYFPNVDRIFSATASGALRLATYTESYLTTNEAKAEALKEMLHTYQKYQISSVNMEKQKRNTALLTYSGKHRGEKSLATIGMYVNIDSFAERVSSMEWRDGYDWLILDSSGYVVKGNDVDFPTGDRVTLEQLQEKNNRIVYTAMSEVCDWTYVLTMPSDNVQNTVAQLRIFFTVAIFASIIISTILIRKAIQINYQPLEELLSVFQKKNDTAMLHKNEYQFIKREIKELMEEKKSAEIIVHKSRKPAQKWELTDLLLKPYVTDQTGTKERVNNYAKVFANGEKMVMVIKIRFDSQSGNNCGLPDELKLFVIENMFLERIGEILKCAMVELEGSQVMVLNDDNIAGKMEQIQETIFELQQIVKEEFDFSVAVIAGTIYQNVAGIHSSYLEAKEAEEFLAVLDQDFIFYEEIKDRTFRGYRYSLQTEERISAALRNDNAQLATALIDKVIDESWASDIRSPHIQKLLLNDIYCTMLKIADEKGSIDQIKKLPKDMTIGKPVGQIKAVYADIASSICRDKKSDATVETDRILCDKVLEYVRENYSDSALNISQTAFHFHMSPANLSATYKNETGKSLLTVINEVRIEKAIALLKQGYTVAETAKMVGIPESSSFIRLFKKQVGTTPGKIKDNL